MLAKEEAESDEIEWIQPSNDDQADSDNDTDQKSEVHLKPENKRPLVRQPSFDMMSTIKTGSTRIKNPKDKKHMETCLVEKGTTENLQNILAATVDDEDEQNWIQPGTTAEDDEPNEMPHNSILQDFKDTISETLHHLHLPHHAKSDGAIKDKHGLLETAMETMLMEQANIMGASGQPVATSDPVETVKFEEKRNSSIDSFKKLLVSPFRRRSSESSNDIKHPKKDKFSLFDSAMKTMLNETAHIIEGVGVHPKSVDETEDLEEIKQMVEQIETCTEEIQEKNSEHESAELTKLDSNVPNLDQNTKYSKFCDNLVTSHVLTNAEPHICTAGNSQSTCEKCTPTLIKRASSKHHKKNLAQKIDPHLNIDRKSLSPDHNSSRLSHDNIRKHSILHTKIKITKSNNNHNNATPINSPSKSLVQCPFVDLINQTNKTKLLALDPHSKHSSHDEKNAQSGKSKTQTSPTKVPTSSSAYNTSSTGAQSAATNLSSSKGKDSKDAKETICRRSSDSDLSVTPKGNNYFHLFHLFIILLFLIREKI